ncbi:Uncharacterised protein [Mycobacteroides abscessus subsp. abscessus]|nr:Uncharacterised protein [Mycobacteroides abscessus subsp. abscessus]
MSAPAISSPHVPLRHTPRAKSAGISPDLATVKARLASPNNVALTPDAVASSAAAPITMNPTCPSTARPASESTWPWFASISGSVITMTISELITT